MAESRSTTRRRYLAGMAGAGVVVLAGCNGDGDDGETPADADDGTPDTVPELTFEEVALSDSFPLELVEPDTEPYTGFASPDQQISNVQYHPDGDTHWHFEPVEVPLDDTRRLRTRFVTADTEAVPLGTDDPFHQEISLAGETPDDLLSIEIDGAEVALTGEREGTGHLVFELWTNEAHLWSTPDLEIEVA